MLRHRRHLRTRRTTVKTAATVRMRRPTGTMRMMIIPMIHHRQTTPTPLQRQTPMTTPTRKKQPPASQPSLLRPTMRPWCPRHQAPSRAVLTGAAPARIRIHARPRTTRRGPAVTPAVATTPTSPCRTPARARRSTLMLASQGATTRIRTAAGSSATVVVRP